MTTEKGSSIEFLIMELDKRRTRCGRMHDLLQTQDGGSSSLFALVLNPIGPGKELSMFVVDDITEN